MNSALGKVVTAVMIDENDTDYFVQPDRNGQTYRLPKMKVPKNYILVDRYEVLFTRMRTINYR